MMLGFCQGLVAHETVLGIAEIMDRRDEYPVFRDFQPRVLYRCCTEHKLWLKGFKYEIPASITGSTREQAKRPK